MAFLLRSIPSAVRLSRAGGTAYGTAKIGVWSDSSKSRDKLREMRKSLYEIEYPAVSKYTKYSGPRPTTSPVSVHNFDSLVCGMTVPAFRGCTTELLYFCVLVIAHACMFTQLARTALPKYSTIEGTSN